MKRWRWRIPFLVFLVVALLATIAVPFLPLLNGGG